MLCKMSLACLTLKCNSLQLHIFYVILLYLLLNYRPGGRFLNDLWGTLTYDELLKHEYYPILRNYG